jgi:8-oxo-dGTP diphosphatase
MPHTPILATLGYVYDQTTDKVLLIHRNLRVGDLHLGKFNGLGGKLESTEDVASGMKRELLEEAGIEVTEQSLRGTINWTGFGKNGDNWFGFIFLITKWNGDPKPQGENPEGTLHWIHRARLLDACSFDEKVRTAAELPMWPGDKYFVPLVFADRAKQFHGYLPYKDGQPIAWNYAEV